MELQLYVDFRIVFDLSNNTLVIGCHHCEAYDGKPMDDKRACALLIGEFPLRHLKTCRREQL